MSDREIITFKTEIKDSLLILEVNFPCDFVTGERVKEPKLMVSSGWLRMIGVIVGGVYERSLIPH